MIFIQRDGSWNMVAREFFIRPSIDPNGAFAPGARLIDSHHFRWGDWGSPGNLVPKINRLAQLDDETLSARIGNFQSFVVFTVIVFGFGASPFCQKRNVGSTSSGTGITALMVSTVVAGRGSSVATLIVFS